MKENNLATRGENVKAKTGPQGKKGVEIVVEEIGERHNFNLMGQNTKPNMSHGQNDERMTSIERSNMGPDYVANPGPKATTQPNLPRPPNNFVTPPSDPNKKISHQNTGEMTREGEIFVDAPDQGTNELSDSDMEVVGAANTSFYRYCKQYVSINKPAMLVIMETRCDPNKLRRTFELLGFDSVVANEVQGFAGGIVVAWQSDCISVDVCKKNFQYLHLKVKYTNGDRWYFTPTYASPIEMTRNLLWNDLQSIAQNMKDPWLVAGDFNDIVCAEEKKGGAAASGRKCKIFKTRIDACSLIDIGAMGPKFTWRGPKYHGGQRIYERLDRALCNGQWRLLFPDGYVKVLTRLDFSDHHPILISPKEVPHPSAPRQFKFESAWLLEEEYDSMLRQCWNSDSTVIENLTNAEREIKAWRFHSIDDVLYKKRELMARIKGTQRRLQTGPYNRGLKRLEQKLQGELSHILRKEELMWFQRSRAKWLKDGDRNTRYYHIKTINRRRMNNITMLKDDSGQWIEDVDQLR
ncbi:unnamed protein product [Trifolium pratense]|uniref:Uncharacterized protein n=1 Tax=Trifolium pratense TaxID=57577 RepID=A0ACB0LY80_TRIPR|nr:unnamed protein product [Trifolium pratense]